MSLRLRNVQVDVPAGGFDRTVAFWADVLDATARPTGGPFTHLVGARSPVGLHLQRLEDGPAGVHLDLEADDVDDEVERLQSLGATRVGRSDHGVVLTDPAGLPLCVVPRGEVVEDLHPERTDQVRLRLVVIDVPSAAVTETVEFWVDALGTVSHDVGYPHTAFTYLGGVEGPGGEYGVLIQDIGEGAEPRIHLDLHVPDPATRDREVERLTAAGATELAGTHHWAVLEDPSGHVFCVVPDTKDHQ